MTFFFDPLPRGRARVVVVDIPWKYNTWGKAATVGDRRPERHYPTMPDDQVIALPVHRLAARDCLLVLWTTWPKMPVALAAMQAWGFRYSTGATWRKLTAGGDSATGHGWFFRGACEPLLIGRRGSPTPIKNTTPNFFLADEILDGALWETRRGRHSAKPETFYDALDDMYPVGCKIDVFARRHRPGWLCWGDELKDATA